MAQKLLLTSQGIQPELKKYFLGLLKKKPEENKVAFVTTAAHGADDGMQPKWLDVYREQLRRLGLNYIEDLELKNKKQKDLEKILSDKDIIFVNGGNTFYLLKFVRKSGFDSVLKDFLTRGGIYVGVSAGSYIACPNIEAATWKHRNINRFGLKDIDLSGLNLVPFLITAHFEEKYRAAIDNAAEKTRYPIIALNDTQAVLVQGEKFKVVGKGKKEYWNLRV